MQFTYEQTGNIGIFNLTGELTSHHEEDLNKTLMKAIYGMDRAVLNFKNVTRFDFICLHLINQAYLTSVRLGNPLILTNIPEKYLSYIVQTKTDKDLSAIDYTDDIKKVASN